MRLQKLDDIRELLHGDAIRVIRHARLPSGDNLAGRVTRELVRRIDDRRHQIAVDERTGLPPAQDDGDGRLNGRTRKVRTEDGMTSVASQRQERSLASFDVAVRRKPETGGGVTARAATRRPERQKRNEQCGNMPEPRQYLLSELYL